MDRSSNAGVAPFASPERAPAGEIRKSQEIILSQRLLTGALDSVQETMLILNSKRQIVFANRNLYELMKTEPSDICGLRPGEAFGCAFSKLNPDGCGASEFCKVCGAVNAILECQGSGARVVKECLMRKDEIADSRAFRVMASPLEMPDGNYVILSLADISDAKMKSMLERMFLHDVMNLAGGIRGFAEILKEERPSEESAHSISSIIIDASTALIDEISAQKELLLAESGELKANLAEIDSLELIKSVSSFFRRSDAAKDKGLSIKRDSASVLFKSDRGLLTRVLGNMIKNAFEATQPGRIVSIGCGKGQSPWSVEFKVANPEAMPADVQLKVFQRSFSTKGEGHGLGTYSMKILGEKYLGGRVSFVSNETEGTVFSLSLK